MYSTRLVPRSHDGDNIRTLIRLGWLANARVSGVESE
ncbi:hypothetical protein CCACVL1_16724 [Corchorus capsularis]|uniref:Uncharacterized protein n=1 Tax=Corchorus capsularis TaxID=210143 RepID=A0A1R3HVX7_COCAP|nr:hypothetical protein CCACVL1_16724 [Corchorus capsularis]